MGTGTAIAVGILIAIPASAIVWSVVQFIKQKLGK